MSWIGAKATAALLGMPKAGFYRMLDRLKVEKQINEEVTILVVECWGGMKYPGQNWRFLEERLRTWMDDQMGSA